MNPSYTGFLRYLSKNSRFFSIFDLTNSRYNELFFVFLRGSLYRESTVCKQLTVFTDQNLSKYQCGFRKDFSEQYSLVAMLERWKGTVDDKKVFGALLTDLSKAIAFDCLSHELMIAKLNAYGFSLPALMPVIYLTKK